MYRFIEKLPCTVLRGRKGSKVQKHYFLWESNTQQTILPPINNLCSWESAKFEKTAVADCSIYLGLNYFDGVIVHLMLVFSSTATTAPTVWESQRSHWSCHSRSMKCSGEEGSIFREEYLHRPITRTLTTVTSVPGHRTRPRPTLPSSLPPAFVSWRALCPTQRCYNQLEYHDSLPGIK